VRVIHSPGIRAMAASYRVLSQFAALYPVKVPNTRARARPPTGLSTGFHRAVDTSVVTDTVKHA
jgi:hypothetical protein